MNLKLNSITAQLYQWFYYETDTSMPTNLCPYFWKVVFMYIFILPLTIISIPAIVIEKINNKSTGIIEGIRDRVMMSLVIYFVLVLIFGMIFMFFPAASDFAIAGGVLGWFISIVALIVYGVERHKKNRSKNPLPKQPNLLTAFIKAKYNKYCPHIDWDN